MSATPLPEGGERLDPGLGLVLPGRKQSAGDGWTWVVEGWRLFARAPLMWIISVVLLVVFAVASNLLPFVGPLAFQVLTAVFVGGLVYACRSLETGGDFELEHLFSGFTRRFGPLAIVGAIMLAAWIALLAVFALIAGFSIMGAFLAGDPEAVASSVASSIGAILLGTLVMLALMVPILAAYWFAPALVMMHGMNPVQALKASFFACLRNIVPFLVYGLAMLVLGMLAVLPFGLGMLVWMPLAITSTYAAYRRIFTEEREPAQAVTTGAQSA